MHELFFMSRSMHKLSSDSMCSSNIKVRPRSGPSLDGEQELIFSQMAMPEPNAYSSWSKGLNCAGDEL